MKVLRVKLGAVVTCIFCILFYLYIYFALKTTQQPNDAAIITNSTIEYKAADIYVPRRIPVIDDEEQRNEFKGEKIVHLDLKGAPPKISYYKKLIPLLATLGATGILIEYEDMFPYAGRRLNNVSALNAYSLDDIHFINTLAKDNKLKVIPLVQTFGHMEFILKLSKYREYREADRYPQAICPSHEHTMDLISDMIVQVVEAHEDIQMIHIGSDEVYHLGICDKCTNVMLKSNLTKNLLFLNHVDSVINFIHKRYPHLRILIWDDHLRSMTANEFHNDTKFEPVVWRYTKEVYEELGPTLWNMYEKVFPRVWVASAFKGATGSNKYVSDVTHYLENHRSWLAVINEYQNRIDFAGIILTGWQRYDHFAVLCELLPVGIPALAMSLRLLLGSEDSPFSPPTDVATTLQCQDPYALIGVAFGTPKCRFPGGGILENAIKLHLLKLDYDNLLEESVVKGWMSEYNIRYEYSNKRYVERVADTLERISTELEQIEGDMIVAMIDVYDNYTIDEWKDTYIEPLKAEVMRLNAAKNALLMKDTWSRRPAHDDEYL